MTTDEQYREHIRRSWGLPRPGDKLDLSEYSASMDVDGSDPEWTTEELAAMCRAFGIPK
jgi:hypothetical protein